MYIKLLYIIIHVILQYIIYIIYLHKYKYHIYIYILCICIYIYIHIYTYISTKKPNVELCLPPWPHGNTTSAFSKSPACGRCKRSPRSSIGWRHARAAAAKARHRPSSARPLPGSRGPGLEGWADSESSCRWKWNIIYIYI